jgi:hypothetical protein
LTLGWSERICRDEVEDEPEGGYGVMLRLRLRLPEETREPWPCGRSPETVRLCPSDEFRSCGGFRSCGELLLAGAVWLLLRDEGLICGCMDIVLEDPAFRSCELRRTGLTSGCWARMVMFPSREASLRLKATLEMCLFWS